MKQNTRYDFSYNSFFYFVSFSSLLLLLFSIDFITCTISDLRGGRETNKYSSNSYSVVKVIVTCITRYVCDMFTFSSVYRFLCLSPFIHRSFVIIESWKISSMHFAAFEFFAFTNSIFLFCFAHKLFRY